MASNPADLNGDGTVTPKEKRTYKKTTAAPRVSNKTKTAATAAARTGGYKDANFDFIPDKDKLSREELAAQYQNAVGIIYSVPELQGVFEQALNEGWSSDQMSSAIQNSEWYRTNAEDARIAWAQENVGGADWQTTLQDAKTQVTAAAVQMGSDLSPQEADALARRFVYGGWGKSGREGYLSKALSEKITYLPDARGETRMVGAAGNLADDLRKTAFANGVNYSDNWYQSAAQSVAGGLTNADDWNRDIRSQAASLWPIYADKINAGMNVYDLASPYINTMAQEFERSPDQITLDNPYIRSAVTGMNDKGDPAPTGLWDFQKKLRQDPRWENTAKAQNEVTTVTGRIMQMFGLMGG